MARARRDRLKPPRAPLRRPSWAPWWLPLFRARTLIVLGALLGVAVGASAYFSSRDQLPIHARTEELERFRAAERALRAEPNVANLVFSPQQGSWNVEVPPGVEVVPGFAGYLCAMLGGYDVVDRRTSVRTVDPIKLEKSGFDYEAATIEHVGCASVLKPRDEGKRESNAAALLP